MTRTRAANRPDPFKALADPTRRGILELLHTRDVRAAREIAAQFQHISRPAVSRHLRVLRQAGLVVAEEIGREQYYRLDRAALARVHRDWFARFTPLMDASLAALKTRVERGAALGRTGRVRRTTAR